ncbi:hypothetical protein C4S75_04505 [Apibacter sp. wkB309]|nr:hypothetical protein C4S75_04505 [Apibacter sp. wkB309]
MNLFDKKKMLIPIYNDFAMFKAPSFFINYRIFQNVKKLKTNISRLLSKCYYTLKYNLLNFYKYLFFSQLSKFKKQTYPLIIKFYKLCVSQINRNQFIYAILSMNIIQLYDYFAFFNHKILSIIPLFKLVDLFSKNLNNNISIFGNEIKRNNLDLLFIPY